MNEQQSEAVNHLYGPCFVSAAPGSGKTRVITERVIKLIESDGIDPLKILCLTFTNKAANEMKERIRHRLGDISSNIYISTFHALCANIIKSFGSYLGYKKNVTIITDDEQESLIMQSARNLDHEIKKPEASSILWAVNNAREKLYKIDSGDFDSCFAKKHHAQIAKEYLHRLKTNNQIDFSGLLSETVSLLKQDGEVLGKLQKRWTFILTDESQDTNLAQFKILTMIGSHRNIFAVADQDQSIYGWRGARYENIQDFIKEFSAKTITLPINYRSTQSIIKAAGKLIKHNSNRTDFEFTTVNEVGEPIECFSALDPDQEATIIANKISSFIRNKKFKEQDIAILYRNNAMSRSIETALMAEGINYQIIGSFGFFDRMEIKDTLSMLRFHANPRDGLALARFINKPSRKIGEAAIGKIEKYAAENNIDLLESLEKSDLYMKGASGEKISAECKKIASVFRKNSSCKDIGEIINSLVEGLQYEDYIKESSEPETIENRIDNIVELANSASVYSRSKNADVIGYLNKVALQSNSDKESEENSVTLMTIHAAKGLEFPLVFVPCLDEGSLPSSRSMLNNEDVSEERRVAYVAFTRGKKKLILSYPENRIVRSGKSISYKRVKPSRFLAESGISNIERNYL